MTLSDLRDYTAALGIAEHVYMGIMDGKQERSIGVYGSKHTHAYKTAIGGAAFTSYGTKYVTFLVHWNKSPRDTENAARRLFGALEEAREAAVNGTTIKFIQPLVNEPVFVGADDDGVCEMVIEAAVIYEREGEKLEEEHGF